MDEYLNKSKYDKLFFDSTSFVLLFSFTNTAMSVFIDNLIISFFAPKFILLFLTDILLSTRAALTELFLLVNQKTDSNDENC